MTRYILTRFTNPISEVYTTLDDALSVCLKEDGNYVIDVRHDDKPQSGQYQVNVTNGTATLTFQP